MNIDKNVSLIEKQYPKILLKNGDFLSHNVINEINLKRGLSYTAAVDQYNIDLKCYDYKLLPVGELDIRLDFKVWGKFSNLELFFTNVADEKKYKISVFQATNEEGDARYFDRDKNYDFSELNNIGAILHVEISKTKKGNFNLLSAKKLT